MKLSLNKVLFFILIGIFFAIIGGTVLVFTLQKETVGIGLRQKDPVPKATKKYDAFTDIGEIRLVSKPDTKKTTGCTIVLSPWFSYTTGDKALYEELSQKKLKFRSIFIGYFSQYTKKELLSHGETAIKLDLKHLINQELILGKIKEVYFNEYIFLE